MSINLRTAEQLRAGRAITRMTQGEFAEAADVSLPTIKRLESLRGALGVQMGTLEKLEAAFTRAGVSFTPEGCICPPFPTGDGH